MLVRIDGCFGECAQAVGQEELSLDVLTPRPMSLGLPPLLTPKVPCSSLVEIIHGIIY